MNKKNRLFLIFLLTVTFIAGGFYMIQKDQFPSIYAIGVFNKVAAQNHPQNLYNKSLDAMFIDFLVEERELQDLFLLHSEELKPLLESAIQYGIKNRSFSNYDYILYFNGAMVPTSIKTCPLPQEENSYEQWVVCEQIPVKVRKINTKYTNPGEGKEDLIQVVEELSSNRLKINFEDLYKKHGWIAHQFISKEYYMKYYEATINLLLLTYSDLTANIKLYDIVNGVMRQHWEDSKTNPYIGLPDYYPNLKKHLSPHTINRIEAYYLPDNTTYQNDYRAIWSYSFWLRRKNEGKTKEIYNTLCAIRDDFTKK